MGDERRQSVRSLIELMLGGVRVAVVLRTTYEIHYGHLLAVRVDLSRRVRVRHTRTKDTMVTALAAVMLERNQSATSSD